MSQKTVNLALRGAPGVNAETRKRIRTLAHEQGYRVNAAARAIRKGRFGVAAMLIRVDQVYLPARLLAGVTRELTEHGMHMTLAEVPDEKMVSDGFVPQILREMCADGLLLDCVPANHVSTIRLLQSHNIPAVWINSLQEADCVYPNDFSASRAATAELIRLGHRRIGYYGVHYSRTGIHHYSETDRLSGYLQAMHEAGLSPRTISFQCGGAQRRGGPDDERVAAARELLSDPERPTAVVTYTIMSAGPAAHAADQLGLRMPEDLPVVTFHADPVTEHG
ncbi:MAG TPA: LacI family DNA-binding transcriptional regulator, partial [Phycisphaerae bacterium]|nr:LacI family DNA-binding transcriptional regulator [Phycisphaerae bacterium]